MTQPGFDWSQLDEQLTDTDWQRTSEPPVESQPISIDPDQDVDAESIDAGPYTEPDAGTIGKPTRPRGALAYQKKLRSVFGKVIKWTALRPSTVPDSAALILYSPRVADTLGELAAKDPRIARGIDLLTESTENPYLDAAIALLPLMAQLARNHEPVIEPKLRGIRIPILMKHPIQLPFKLGIRLGVLRAATHEPTSVADHVMNTPEVRRAFERQGIEVPWPRTK